MATSDNEQKGEFVRQHKRLAMGVPLTGQSTKSKDSKPKSGGLSHVLSKKNK